MYKFVCLLIHSFLSSFHYSFIQTYPNRERWRVVGHGNDVTMVILFRHWFCFHLHFETSQCHQILIKETDYAPVKQLTAIVCLFVLLVFNGTFSTNRLYRAIRI